MGKRMESKEEDSERGFRFWEADVPRESGRVPLNDTAMGTGPEVITLLHSFGVWTWAESHYRRVYNGRGTRNTAGKQAIKNVAFPGGIQ